MKSKTTAAGMLFVCLWASVVSFTSAQAPVKTRSAFEYIGSTDGAEIQLEFDLTELLNQKKTNNYFPATLTSADGSAMALEVRPRGKFRRMTCDIPPLKLKFAKKTLRAFRLDTLNEVRLALPCADDKESEALLMKEYLAYKIYERLNPDYHVRARLIKVAIRDKHVEKTRPAAWALLIEHEEELEARLKGKIVETYNIDPESLHKDYTALNAVFQFLIGNTDWNVADFRNIYQFETPEGTIVPIPYDFDFSGLVSAPYASPNPDLGLRTVKDRALMGNGIAKSDLQTAMRKITNAKADILALCEAPYFDPKTTKELQKYLGDFFREIQEEEGDIPNRIGNMR